MPLFSVKKWPPRRMTYRNIHTVSWQFCPFYLKNSLVQMSQWQRLTQSSLILASIWCRMTSPHPAFPLPKKQSLLKVPVVFPRRHREVLDSRQSQLLCRNRWQWAFCMPGVQGTCEHGKQGNTIEQDSFLPLPEHRAGTHLHKTACWWDDKAWSLPTYYKWNVM